MFEPPAQTRPETGGSIRLRKLRPDGSEAFAWEGTLVRWDTEGVRLRALFNVPVRDLGYVTLRAGDVFEELYYWHRWYNVFRISSPEGTLKGWYCNLGAPPVDEGAGVLSYVDLALDVWVRPDGSYVVLDEDELAAILADPALPDALRAGAAAGGADLLRLVESGRLPDLFSQAYA